MNNAIILGGDCLQVLRDMESESVHAIVTDPPYGLSEVGSEKLTTALTAWVNGDRERVPSGKGFMGKEWDAFVPPPAVWDECMRVLKPGGHVLVFAGSRTVDLMGLSIRLAGFEIRDTLQWLYGSGFPKSQNISKQIDKAGGDPLAFKRFASAYATAVAASEYRHIDIDRHLGIKSSSCYWSRTDHRGGLPPRHHWEKVRDLLKLDADLERLYDEAERLDRKVGKAGSNRVFSPTISVDFAGTPATDAAREWSGWGTALKPAAEPIILARKPLASTVARNVLAHGVGGLNIDGCRVSMSDTDRDAARVPQRSTHGYANLGDGEGRNGERFEPATGGRFPANVILSHSETCSDEQCDLWCPVAELDAQSGASVSRVGNPRSSAHPGVGWGMTATGTEYDDSGGASRFFASFRYQAKAPKRERPKVDGVSHPTVKPVALMRWLVRLVTPPGGTVLDPFAGSGTTLQAASEEGFASIGIERDDDYLKLINVRLGFGEGEAA